MTGPRFCAASTIGLIWIAAWDGVARVVSGDADAPSLGGAAVSLGSAVLIGAALGLVLWLFWLAASANGPARSFTRDAVAAVAGASSWVVPLALAALALPLCIAVPVRAKLLQPSPHLAAAVGLAALAAAWALFCLVGRRLEKRPGRRLSRRFVGFALLAAAAAIALAAGRERPYLDVADLWDLVLLGGGGLVFLGATALLPAFHLSRRATAVVAAAVVASGGLALFGLNASASVRSEIASSWRPGLWALELAAYATDLDGDGFSRFFGGGDCDDSNADINPDAIEIPGNGVDENCRDGDSLPAPPWPPRPTFVPLPDGNKLPRSVLILSVDTFCRHHLSLYGYERPTSPRLEELAKRGVLFERAYSSAPTTRIAIPVLFTGRSIGEIPWDRRMSPYGMLDTAQTLPEILKKEKGLETTAFITHRYFTKKWNWLQGFDEIDKEFLYNESEYRDVSTGAAIVERLSGWLEEHKETPFLAWIHLMDAHLNFIKHPEGPDFGDETLDRYDSEIWYVDWTIGEIMDKLAELGIDDDTIVVVLADHGEHFGEHGKSGHGTSLYEEVAHIPMIIKAPGIPARSSPCVAGLVDVAPTILNLFGIDGAKYGMSGATLVPDMTGAPCPDDRETVLEIRYGRNNAPDVRAIVGQRWKLFSDTKKGLFRFYDLQSDAKETKNVASEHPAEFEAMKRRMLAWTDFYANRDMIEAIRSLTSDAPPAAATRIGATFANGIELVAVDSGSATVSRNTPLDVQLFLRTSERVRQDCEFVFELVEDDGTLRYEARMPPVSGSLPVSRWPLGKVVNDSVGITWLGGRMKNGRLSPGIYGARLWFTCDGRRVSVESGPSDADGRAVLGEIRVQKSSREEEEEQ
jgi:choline-sulfatase